MIALSRQLMAHSKAIAPLGTTAIHSSGAELRDLEELDGTWASGNEQRMGKRDIFIENTN